MRTTASLMVALAVGLAAAPCQADEVGDRVIAALPFGAGQFHRHAVGLGAFFAVGEALFGGASIATWAVTERLSSADPSSHLDAAALNRQIKAVATVNWIMFAGWATLTAVGILEAQISLPRSDPKAPKERERPRALLTVAGAPGGGSIRVVF